MNLFKTMSYRSYGEQKAFVAMMISMHGVEKIKVILNQMVRTNHLTSRTADRYLSIVNLMSNGLGAKKHV